MNGLLLLTIIFAPVVYLTFTAPIKRKRISPKKVSRPLRTNRQPRDIFGRYEGYQVEETAWIIGPDRL